MTLCSKYVHTCHWAICKEKKKRKGENSPIGTSATSPHKQQVLGTTVNTNTTQLFISMESGEYIRLGCLQEGKQKGNTMG